MPAGKAVHSLEFSPDGNVLAAGGEQRVYLWDVASRRSVGELRWGHERAVTGLAFSSDGNQLLSVGGRVILWNLDRRHWLQEACRVANRNLSRQEWADVMDKETPYERICPGLPEPSVSSSH
jgi:WD40 repeat protein